MDQIQSMQSANLQSPMLAKAVQQETKTVTPPEIKDGDNKSMQALKWAGIIGAGALLAVGACKMMKGKTPEIDAKWFDADALKKGQAVLTKEGKEEAAKLAKKCSGISKDGTIGDIKIIQTDGDKKLTHIFNSGKRTQIDKVVSKNGTTQNITQVFNDKGKVVKSIVDGKEVTLEYYGNGKLAKSTKDGATTVYEYATVGIGDKAEEKLARKTVGDQTTTFKYRASDGRISSKTLPDGNEINYQYTKVGDKTVLENVFDDNDLIAQEYSYHENGKLASSFISSFDGKNTASVKNTNFNEKGDKVLQFNTLFNGDNSYGEIITKDSKFSVNTSKQINPENGHSYGLLKIDNNNIKTEIQTDVKDGNLILRYIDDKGNMTEFGSFDELLEANKGYFEKCSDEDMDLLKRMFFGWDE